MNIARVVDLPTPNLWAEGVYRAVRRLDDLSEFGGSGGSMAALVRGDVLVDIATRQFVPPEMSEAEAIALGQAVLAHWSRPGEGRPVAMV